MGLLYLWEVRTCYYLTIENLSQWNVVVEADCIALAWITHDLLKPVPQRYQMACSYFTWLIVVFLTPRNTCVSWQTNFFLLGQVWSCLSLIFMVYLPPGYAMGGLWVLGMDCWLPLCLLWSPQKQFQIDKCLSFLYLLFHLSASVLKLIWGLALGSPWSSSWHLKWLVGLPFVFIKTLPVHTLPSVRFKSTWGENTPANPSQCWCTPEVVSLYHKIAGCNKVVLREKSLLLVNVVHVGVGGETGTLQNVTSLI